MASRQAALLQATQKVVVAPENPVYQHDSKEQTDKAKVTKYERDLPDFVKNRDVYVDEYAHARPVETAADFLADPPIDQPYRRFDSGPVNRMRPVIYKPDGSFECLYEQGKLCSMEEADEKRAALAQSVVQARASRGASEFLHGSTRLGELNRGSLKRQKDCTAPGSFKVGESALPTDIDDGRRSKHVPGYTGYVRGLQHISGRTYGSSTQRALDTDYRELVCTSPVPCDPEHNRKIELTANKKTFASATFAKKKYHVPGYTGFVPGYRFTHAKTYGAATSQELLNSSLRHPRRPYNEEEGYADTAYPRKPLYLASDPLPGTVRTQKPPDKLIPAHITYLKFFPM